MRFLSILLIVLAMAIAHAAEEPGPQPAERDNIFKRTGKQIGRDAKTGTKQAGQAFKKLGKDIARGTSKAAKDIGHSVKESAEKTGKAAKEAVK